MKKFLLDILRNPICLLKLPFLASLSINFSTICSHMLSKFVDKPAQKISIFPSKAGYARYLLFSVLGLLFIEPTFAKVRIITFHCNRPHFIELQHKTLQKFMLDDYELIVFNDGASSEIEREIRETCEKFGVQCIRFQPEWHLTDPLNQKIKQWLVKNPDLQCSHFNTKPPHVEVTLECIRDQGSVRHSHLIQYALDNYGYNHNDIVAIMDGDAFPIRPISLRKKLKKFDIFGMSRHMGHIDYLWVPFIAFDPAKLPNLRDLRFNMAVIDNRLHDTGSQVYHYLKKNPSVKSKQTRSELSHKLARSSSKKLKAQGFSEEEIWLIKQIPKSEKIEFNIDRSILHFGAGRIESEGNRIKYQYLCSFIDAILNK